MTTGFMIGLAVLIAIWIYDGAQSEIGLTDLVTFCGGGAFIGWLFT